VRFGAESSRHTLEFGFQKRLSNRWQASGQYQLSRFRDFEPQPNVGFQLAPDFGGEWTLGVGDQRHRAVFNGIVDVGYGFQVSGIYFYGSGERFATNTGVDRRGEGANAASELRLRADGTIIPRAAIVGEPIHRFDARLQKRLPLGSRVTVDGLFEVYNLFNHTNYGSYTTNESNARFGQPSFNGNVAYQPRMLQLGFRVAF